MNRINNVSFSKHFYIMFCTEAFIYVTTFCNTVYHKRCVKFRMRVSYIM